MTSPGRAAACSNCAPQLRIAGCTADRYSARMQRTMSAFTASATAREAEPSPIDVNCASRMKAGAFTINPSCASPTPGVCHDFAMSCHS